jgi:hypothetical protein
MAVQSKKTTPDQPKPQISQRTDNWWVSPLVFAVVFGFFALWATFRAFQNNYYEVGHYLSPFYSPTIKLPWKIAGFEISPALIILPFPLAFRMTCYYYRKAIYRSFAADPLACAVREPEPLNKLRWKFYTGERIFPLIAMNFHRFAFYCAVVFIVLLWYDALKAFLFVDDSGTNHFGMGLGTVIFVANVCLLSLYTFSCHSWRHLIGGKVDCYSCTALNKTRYGLWTKISFINAEHGRYAMMSLVSVLITDIYVYLLATKVISDFRFF